MGALGGGRGGPASEMGGILMGAEFDFVESRLAPGLSVIEASAGTGKTYAISHLVPRLLLEGTASRLSEILLVTFTNDAARELSDRVRRVLEKLHAPPAPDEEEKENGVFHLRKKFAGKAHAEVISRALLDIDQLGVSTFHSFSQRTLQTEGVLCGLPVIPELITNSDDVVAPVLYDLWQQRIASDDLASAVASAAGWALENDMAFARFALSLHDAVPVPAPQPFGKSLKKLEDAAGLFTDEICDELLGFIGKVSNWTNSAPDESGREALVKTLREARSAADDGFFDAVAALASLETWVNGRGKVGAALKAEAAVLRGVALAREITGCLDGIRWDWRNEFLGEIRTTIARTLHANRQITYDGLIETLCLALRGDQASALAQRLRARYKVALIDESQDTDPRQFEIFRKVFVGLDGEPPLAMHRLVLIGDPKQAIYAFRGADVNTYLDAKKLAGSQVFHLNKTFRSPAPLVKASNAIFSRPGSLLKDGLQFLGASSGLKGDLLLRVDGKPREARIEAWIVPDDGGEEYSNSGKRLALIAGTVATEIVAILNARSTIERISPDGGRVAEPVLPGHFAVLVSDRYQADAVTAALQERRVPAIQAGGDDVMGSEEAADLLALLRAIQDPRRSGLRFAALATRLLGRNDAGIRAIRESSQGDDDILEKFLRWQATLQREGIAPALAQIDSEESVTLRLASMERGERRVTNLRQIMDLLQSASLEVGGHSGNLVRWFAQEIARSGDRSDAEDRQQQLESDADAVQIVTMHSAKGLEYPLVFCPFLWSSKVPKGIVKLGVPGHPPQLVDTGLAQDSSIDAAITREAIEDRLRLAYVAITRARASVWISAGEVCGKRTPASALDWLLRPDDGTDFETWRAGAGGPGRGTRHAAGWDALVSAARAGDVAAAKEPPAATPDCWVPPGEKSSPAIAASDMPHIPEPWVMTSFSSLTREKNPHSGGDASAANSPADPPNPFFSAPGGAMVGTAVHDWIEHWDFSTPAAGAVREHLRKYPLHSPAGEQPMHERVEGMLEELRAAVLPSMGCTIAEACPRPESSEWHFQLPISDCLSAHALAAVFAAHGEAGYAAMLEALPAEKLKGYLHGFLDRLAFCNGVWGVIDWKTNKLDGGYGQDSLLACARQSHYLLQTHLYLVALRRFLGPDVAISGAWLVFLRGIHSGSSDGILHIQPSDALMKDLDGLFAKPSARLSA